MEQKNKNNPEITMLSDRLGKVVALSSLKKSEGGKVLIEGSLNHVVGLVDTICNKFDRLTLQEFIAIGAGLKHSLDLARVISHSDDNVKQTQEDLKVAFVALDKVEEIEEENKTVLP